MAVVRDDRPPRLARLSGDLRSTRSAMRLRVESRARTEHAVDRDRCAVHTVRTPGRARARCITARSAAFCTPSVGAPGDGASAAAEPVARIVPPPGRGSSPGTSACASVEQASRRRHADRRNTSLGRQLEHRGASRHTETLCTDDVDPAGVLGEPADRRRALPRRRGRRQPPSRR